MSPLTHLLSLSFLFSLSSQHFLLNAPQTVGFDDDAEATGPCGGQTVDFTKDNVTDFHVGGDSIWVTNTHPTANFLFRATQDLTAQGNWTTLRQPIQQVGLGDSCEPAVAVPSSFEGKKGVIQVVANSPDGILYQCAAVNFVSGTGPAGGVAGCKNGSAVTLSYTSDSSLSGLGSSSNSTAPSGSSTSSAAPKSTSSSAAVTSMKPAGYGAAGALVWMALVAVGTGAVRLL